ncbi:hypothetical protein ACQP2F_06915 [Actinoplanes sp. CA-030573]|uniref:hypothetical protein n=1 Tax=Actinoplanes sp. CA-030573 TaxID=3239898 RepID=UPI003D8D045D
MPYGNAAPVTGGAGALVLSHFLGLDTILAAAIIAVLFGISAFRYGSRIRRGRKAIFTLAGAAVAGVAYLAHTGGLSWTTSAALGLAAAVTALVLSSRLVPQERRAVA